MMRLDVKKTYDELSLAKRLELLWLADLRGRRGDGSVIEVDEDVPDAAELLLAGAARSDCSDSDDRGWLRSTILSLLER